MTATRDQKPPLYLDDKEAVGRFIASIANTRAIALDTEGASFHRFIDRIYLLQLSTTMSAELYGIDPFDQPGVEHDKQAAYAQLGRGGFEDLAKRLADYRKLPRRTC